MTEPAATVTAPESLRARVAEEVRALLARRRMSATELARALGVSQTYVWRRLSAEVAFDLDDLERIAGVLRVRLSDVVPFGDEPPPATVPGRPQRRGRESTPRYARSTQTRPRDGRPATKGDHNPTEGVRRPVRINRLAAA